ncbi:MAG: hypothetical protein ACPG6B_00745 [Oceanihabitans sp.]
MKTFKCITLSLLIALVLFSCKSDDDSGSSSEPTLEERIAYKWYYKQIYSPETDETTIADACEQNSFYNFLSNGNALIEIFTTASDASCESSGLYQPTYIVGEFEGETGLFLTFEDGSTEGYIIVSINNSTLVLEQRGFGIRQMTFTKE